MICGSCGGELPSSARFCGYCGTAVTQTTTLAPPPVPPGAFLEGEDEGPTITFSGYATARWEAVLPSGMTVPIDGPLLLGRRPDAAAGPVGARLLTVEDPRRTVSRTHLVLAPSAAGVVATDVSGRGGIVVTAADGSEQRATNASIELTAACRIGLGLVSIWLQPV